ncbi:MAG: GTPase ObgE [Elusimicrobia bacterium RIFCSPLOWO2_01_FULL_54_10]|nr:MAG: GTPase ObgE [Elusimicrobia bacterium RIFCSPLOWO2_01_FULL_54_10]
MAHPSFLDKTRIFVQAGDGGNGSLSFRREKFVEWGGPNGGNGGIGGDVILEADENLTTLLDLTYRPHFKAQNGDYGKGWDKHGRAGEDLIIQLPVGTAIYENGQILGDMTEHGQKLLIAKGGRGGRGNASFKSTRNTAPKIAELGEPGEIKTLDLELKLIADVGLVGCPNAGKSTLLSRISAARPKIANYPFTTLSPNLGVIKFRDKSFVAADIPGLIEGAHSGKGLGTEFLRHIERTRILVHMLDMSGFSGMTPHEAYKAVSKELALYSKKLAKKPVLIVANKMDLTSSPDELKKFRKKLKGKKILPISGVTGEGIDALIAEAVKLLEKTPKEKPPVLEVPQTQQFHFDNEFIVEREEAGFRVIGKKVERFFAMTNFEQEQAVTRFQNILRKMGVEKVLEKQGIQPGDSVLIGNDEFIYEPGSISKSRRQPRRVHGYAG